MHWVWGTDTNVQDSSTIVLRHVGSSIDIHWVSFKICTNKQKFQFTLLRTHITTLQLSTFFSCQNRADNKLTTSVPRIKTWKFKTLNFDLRLAIKMPRRRKITTKMAKYGVHVFFALHKDFQGCKFSNFKFNLKCYWVDDDNWLRFDWLNKFWYTKKQVIIILILSNAMIWLNCLVF